MNQLIFIYEKSLFYSGIAYSEYSKIGQYVRDTLLLVTALAVRGIKPTKWQIGIFFIGIILISIGVGIVLVNLKVPQYNNTLNNQQNLQMQTILNNQQLILEKLK